MQMLRLRATIAILAASISILPAHADPPVLLSTSEVPVREIRPPHDPANILVHDDNLYVSGFKAGRVSALNLLNGKSSGQVTLDGYEQPAIPATAGLKPHPAGVHPFCGGPLVWAAGKVFAEQTGSDTLLAIDPASMRVIRRIPAGGEGALVVAPDGTFLVYASNRKNEFRLIDSRSYRSTTVPYPADGRGCLAATVSPDGRFVLLGLQRGGQPPNGAPIAGGNSFLAVYDRREKKYVATVYLAESATESVSEFVAALTYSPDGTALYAGMFQSKAGVRVIDPKTWSIVGDIRFARNARNKHFEYTNPLGLRFYRDRLFVANRENQEVVVIDPTTRKAAAILRFPQDGHEFRQVAVAGDRVYLADQSSVYELDGWALARRLAVRPEAEARTALELTLVTGRK